MPKLIVVLISWSTKAPLLIISLAVNVVAFMTKNVLTFPTPDVVLGDITTAADRLQKAYNNRLNGDEAKLEYDKATNALDLMLHNQALYVNKIAKGNSAIIAKAGYKFTSNAKVKKTITAAPAAAVLKTNGGGGLKITLEKVLNATSYLFVVFFGEVGSIIVGKNYVQPSLANAIMIPDAKLIERLSGITAGTNVTVIPFAKNSAGISPAGPPITAMVN